MNTKKEDKSVSDPTGFGIRNMTLFEAKITIPLMNGVFDLINKKAEFTEKWSNSDGVLYKNLSYGEYRAQKYDMYIPHGLDTKQPIGVVLFIHGGTWTMGRKEHMAAGCAKVAKAGYIAVTMNYNLLSDGNKNVARVTGSKENANAFDMLEDISACICAVKVKLKCLGYTPKSLALSGVSAGSHLAALYAYSRMEESAIPIRMIFTMTMPVSLRFEAFDNYDYAGFAAIASLVVGKKISEEEIRNSDPEIMKILDILSPSACITKNSVPTLMGFAGKDKTIGTNQYPTIKPVLDKYGVVSDVIWWENSDHTLTKDKGKVAEFFNTAIEWLNKYM